MSTKSDVLYHPLNQSKEQTWEGFSWPAFFFGAIWLLIKGLWGQALVYVILIFATFGIGMFVLPFVYGFIGNGLHKSLLLKGGYLTKSQVETQPAGSARSGLQPQPRDAIGQLKDLADLRDRGVLSEAEFQMQKTKAMS